MTKRSELREKIMTILYQIEMYKKSNYNYDTDKVIKENLEINSDFVLKMVYGVIDNYDELNNIVNKYLNNWTIDRIETLGACILRMSIFEIKYMDTPDIVVINEALELAKKYCDDKVKHMINSVLDKIVNE